MFDDSFAESLVGRSLLVGITERDHNGILIRRHQLFGVVAVANRKHGICVRESEGGPEMWLPPDTAGIVPAAPGEYRNRNTGEVVVNPDYTASLTITKPAPAQ